MESPFSLPKRKLPPPSPLRLPVSPSPRPWTPSLDDFYLQLPHLHGSPGDSSHLEEAMWHMTLQSPEEMDYATGPFPERPGEQDCLYYIRTGLCGFGMSCRFNHPRNRTLAAALARDKGEYPERIGQPECQYYLKTGTCKFGLTCKFHHPRERTGPLGRVTLNVVGLPLRPGEKDCAYYMRTGSCKFGPTCKFNHPQLAAFGTLVAMSGSTMYASSGSPSAPSPQPFPTGIASWPIARAPYMPGSRFQGFSSFAPLIVSPQSLVSMPGWSTFQARIGPTSSLEVQQQALGANFVYGTAAPTDAASAAHASYNPYAQASAATGFLSSQMQSTSLSKSPVFPERHGMPECQYYMKTGDCKFGLSCRYHHPRERLSSLPTSILSPIGLPLRPGVQQCMFYTRYGICKFGPTCKFDHPMSALTYSPSASSLADIPVAPYPVGSPVAFLVPSSETAGQGSKSIFKKSASISDEHTAYENPYMDSDTDKLPPTSVQIATASVNQLSRPDSADSRGSSCQDAWIFDTKIWKCKSLPTHGLLGNCCYGARTIGMHWEVHLNKLPWNTSFNLFIYKDVQLIWTEMMCSPKAFGPVLQDNTTFSCRPSGLQNSLFLLFLLCCVSLSSAAERRYSLLSPLFICSSHRFTIRWSSHCDEAEMEQSVTQYPLITLKNNLAGSANILCKVWTGQPFGTRSRTINSLHVRNNQLSVESSTLHAIFYIIGIY